MFARHEPPNVVWPDHKSFAFSVFDDPDAQTCEDGRLVYSLMLDLGLRTTRGVWPSGAMRTPNSPGETCADARYRQHTLELQAQGFDVGYHNTTCHSSTRPEIITGLDLFRAYFGHDPDTMANHYNAEAIYWGRARISPPLRAAYGLATWLRPANVFFGDVEGQPLFWGDLCRERVRYCRNFVYAEVNTLKACPWMPYYDPLRPYVNAWYASSEGSNVVSFTRMLSEANQDRLEEEGGACIMYAHFGHGFVEGRGLDRRFRELMTRLSRKNGWFVPVSRILDHLRSCRETITIEREQRYALERRWLWEKLQRGTS